MHLYSKSINEVINFTFKDLTIEEASSAVSCDNFCYHLEENLGSGLLNEYFQLQICGKMWCCFSGQRVVRGCATFEMMQHYQMTSDGCIDQSDIRDNPPAINQTNEVSTRAYLYPSTSCMRYYFFLNI